MMNYRNCLGCIAATLLYTVCSIVQAATATTTLDVTAAYNTLCSIDSLSTLSFGTIYDNSVDYTAAASAAVVCTNGQTYGVWIPPGANQNGPQQRMLNASTGAYVNYSLYTDSYYVTAYPSTLTFTGSIGIGSTQIFTIYAKLPAGQGLTPGVYSDVIQFTVSY
jgi:spore coat protein U-like protein